MTLRDYTLIACSLTTLGTVANLINLVPLPWWLVLSPVVLLAIAASVAVVMLVRARK